MTALEYIKDMDLGGRLGQANKKAWTGGSLLSSQVRHCVCLPG
jgi:hypothetical protein